MATVYSLVCWGGSAGKSTGLSANAATDLFTLTNHGAPTGMAVRFTAGTLPNNSGTPVFTINTPYYVRYVTSSTFSLHPTKADAEANTNQITFNNAGSGLTLKSEYYSTLASTSRWSTRIYESLNAWLTGRASASV